MLLKSFLPIFLQPFSTALPDTDQTVQVQGIIAARPVPKHTTWRQRHACVNNLAPSLLHSGFWPTVERTTSRSQVASTL